MTPRLDASRGGPKRTFCNEHLCTCSAVSHRMQSRLKCMLLQGYSPRFAEENEYGIRLDRSLGAEKQKARGTHMCSKQANRSR